MGDLTFGEPLHMLDDSKYDPWVSVIFASIKFGSRFNLLAYYPWLASIVKANLPAKFQKKKYEHFQYSVERVTKRLDRGRTTEGRDLWDYALGQEEGKQLSRGEMDANSTLFMLAGTETTATLLSGLTYLLLKNPSKMAALSGEIRGAFENEKDMSMEAIAALPYLAACLKEALRLYPPVPVGLPHLTPANGSTICGQFVPPGVCTNFLRSRAPLTRTRQQSWRLTTQCIPHRSTSKTQWLSPPNVGWVTTSLRAIAGLRYSHSLLVRETVWGKSETLCFLS